MSGVSLERAQGGSVITAVLDQQDPHARESRLESSACVQGGVEQLASRVGAVARGRGHHGEGGSGEYVELHVALLALLFQPV